MQIVHKKLYYKPNKLLRKSLFSTFFGQIFAKPSEKQRLMNKCIIDTIVIIVKIQTKIVFIKY